MTRTGALDFPAAGLEPIPGYTVRAADVAHSHRLAEAVSPCTGSNGTDDPAVAHNRLLVIQQGRGGGGVLQLHLDQALARRSQRGLLEQCLAPDEASRFVPCAGEGKAGFERRILIPDV